MSADDGDLLAPGCADYFYPRQKGEGAKALYSEILQPPISTFG